MNFKSIFEARKVEEAYGAKEAEAMNKINSAIRGAAGLSSKVRNLVGGWEETASDKTSEFNKIVKNINSHIQTLNKELQRAHDVAKKLGNK